MKLATILATCLLAVASVDSVKAQAIVPGVVVPATIEQTISPNLITNPTFNGTTGWSTTGAVGGAGNGYTFTYSQGTIAQTYAINQALAGVGAGVQIAGFDYGFKYRFGCANSIGGYCENPAGIQDTLNATSLITSNTGATLYTRYYALGSNATSPYSSTFSTVDTQQRFNSSVPITNLGTFQISFTGQDNGYWAGNYGPTIKDVYSKAVYTVDPCAANALSSPSCAGYNDILTSQNIAATTYAVNQALNLSGSGVMIHGYRYGYTVNLGASWYGCTATNQDGSCSWYMSTSPYATVATSVRDNTNTLIRPIDYQNYSGTNSVNDYSFSVVFDNSRKIGTMGNFSMGVGTSGNASVTNKWSNWQYTPDLCVANPLYSTTCEGYAEAYKAMQCSANALYDPSCPGYAVAFKTQQCTINALYDPTCPGYAAAYLNYQCSLNPLYSTTCAGYEQAYLNAQCILDSLYSNRCEGYATAYAIKYLVPNIDSTAVNSSLSSTAATKASDPTNKIVATDTASTTVGADGTVSTGVSTTGNTTVDSAITSKTTSTAPTNPSAPVNLTQAPAPAPAAPAQNDRREGAGEKRDQKAEGGSQSNTQQAQGNSQDQKSDQPKTARQEMQAKREAAAKTEAVEKGKNLANEMSKAADMAQQVAVQNVVIQAMGFTPGFDTYNKTVMRDAPMYRPYTVYGGQQTVDNRRLSRGLFGATDNLHNSMIEQQYK